MADTDHLGRNVVVVTGTGIITPLGQGQQENWHALTHGVSGIHRITRFPISGSPRDRSTRIRHRHPAASRTLVDRLLVRT